ncbi:hypothetical protein [Legionella spiritensis]|uniref:Secreted protein n=1 Tax=Legionella spiritensis TaxID=452 RepID=A0A0W0YXZ8_LEGSP|nr:hypothetical protein [Legionella spiritensis]KTD61753.1 hypothetical protein Lspi_2383 [Legionella spiritensis]SNV38599.1 Uncharacterised protein [Legionella spiritensis]VEG90235.1 Uncharacterised protein [Legionella spiritensis]
MKYLLPVVLSLVCSATVVAASTSDFVVCKSTYALCTTAKCAPVAGKKDLVSCHCDVKTGYSASQQPCQGLKKIGGEISVYSRYYPVRSYAVCTNKRPWAWCLDKPCLVDRQNPSKATCTCSLVKNLGDYVIVTDKKSASTCTTGIISSATVEQITQITDFLKTTQELPPDPIKVLK